MTFMWSYADHFILLWSACVTVRHINKPENQNQRGLPSAGQMFVWVVCCVANDENTSSTLYTYSEKEGEREYRLYHKGL